MRHNDGPQSTITLSSVLFVFDGPSHSPDPLICLWEIWSLPSSCNAQNHVSLKCSWDLSWTCKIWEVLWSHLTNLEWFLSHLKTSVFVHSLHHPHSPSFNSLLLIVLHDMHLIVYTIHIVSLSKDRASIIASLCFSRHYKCVDIWTSISNLNLAVYLTRAAISYVAIFTKTRALWG